MGEKHDAWPDYFLLILLEARVAVTFYGPANYDRDQLKYMRYF